MPGVCLLLCVLCGYEVVGLCVLVSCGSVGLWLVVVLWGWWGSPFWLFCGGTIKFSGYHYSVFYF